MKAMFSVQFSISGPGRKVISDLDDYGRHAPAVIVWIETTDAYVQTGATSRNRGQPDDSGVSRGSDRLH